MTEIDNDTVVVPIFITMFPRRLNGISMYQLVHTPNIKSVCIKILWSYILLTYSIHDVLYDLGVVGWYDGAG